MSHSLVPDPNPRIRDVLLGTSVRPVNMAEVSRRTGIPAATLNKYKKRPDLLPLSRAVEIAEALQLKNEDWIRIYRG